MRRILITGASGGLAQALIALLDQDQLFLVGRSKERLDQVYGNHPHIHTFEVDICQKESVQRLVETIEDGYGPLDILINTAGYGFYQNFEEFSASDIQDMFAVNTFASMYFCQALAPYMKRRKKGHLINVVSISGLVATAQSSLYSSTKFAMIGFSNAIRQELAPYHVYVTSINTGPVATSFFDLADPDGSYQQSVRPFMLQTDQVARDIKSILGKSVREVNRPRNLALAVKFQQLFPSLSDFFYRKFFNFKSK